ncbi:MAG: hypothetical protein IPK59_01155 [Rhodospirillaceae bacterium]|nr:hypothetical protein [Rhodospirillaceae bacterium]
MPNRLQELADEIIRLHAELDREIEQRRKALGWNVNKKFIEFEHGIVLQHRRLRKTVGVFIAQAPIGYMLSVPIIYSLIVPLVLVDLWASLYQAICFRIYRVPQVRRADYVTFDRRHLAYLNWIEALNCVYCGYANGVIGYIREIGSRTEQFWCPIKHALRVPDPHQRYYEFLEYGDADGYRARLEEFRDRLRNGEAA